MTACHRPTGVRPLMFPIFRRGISGVTGSKAVTDSKAVTQETIATQGGSSLSPVSPVKSIPPYIRAIGVWSCHLSPVTPVTGDRTETAPVSRTVANRLAQLSQPIGAQTAREQKIPKSQINVLRYPIWRGRR
jgi:hypothetical protein